eukprot:m51a1_g4593 putative otubain-like histone deubiquitinase 1 (353) ;mRNA; r:195745-197148
MKIVLTPVVPPSQQQPGTPSAPPPQLPAPVPAPPAVPAASSAPQRPPSKRKRPSAAAGDQRDCAPGYNSGDERAAPPLHHAAPDAGLPVDVALRRRGFEVHRMIPDGNCMFRAVADEVFGDAELHGMVRDQVVDYIVANRDHYSQYIAGEDFASYVRRKRLPREHGNHVELQAVAELYGRPVEVYARSADQPMNVFHGAYALSDVAPMRLLYSNGNHYDAVVDPARPAVGVGLGIPNYKPMPLDLQQTAKAVAESEADDVERALLESVRRDSEMSVSQKDIEQAVMAASRAEYLEKLCAAFGASVAVPAPPANSSAAAAPSSSSPRAAAASAQPPSPTSLALRSPPQNAKRS